MREDLCELREGDLRGVCLWMCKDMASGVNVIVEACRGLRERV